MPFLRDDMVIDEKVFNLGGSLDDWSTEKSWDAIKVGEVEKPFPWKPVAVGAGILGAILLVPKKKKE